jgi:hypothetical protein
MEKSEYGVNYIQHLTQVYIRIADDDRLTSNHVSIYMALFQLWNTEHFPKSFIIMRQEVMQLSKVTSKSNYHRCLKQLSDFGYISYEPSHNAMVGSRVSIMAVLRSKTTKKHSPNRGQLNRQLNGQQERQHNELLIEQPLGQPTELLRGQQNEPLYNKHINNKKLNKRLNFISAKNEFSAQQADEKNEKIVSKSEKKERVLVAKFTPPKLEEIYLYFREKNAPEIEGQKFFNYFESNGWKIGGRSPMKNWKAAANNWILNAEKYNPKAQQSNLHLNQDKDYEIPL